MNRKWKLARVILLISLCLVVLSACGAGANKNNASTDNNVGIDETPANGNNDNKVNEDVVNPVDDNDEQVMTEFNALIEKNSSTAELIRYMNKNIADVSEENASKMAVLLEQEQKEQLKALETRFFEENGIQEKLQKLYKIDPDFKNIETIEDADLKQLLTDVRDGGYKIETAEGMYYPVIDYELYNAFSPNVTKDIAAYINIMGTESKEVPAKDAAIIIGWDKVVNRSMQQEQFITENPNSVKLTDIQGLHKKYLQFTYLGSNNTPLFNYDSKMIEPDAKKAYTEAISNNQNSEYLTNLSKFLDLVNKNNGKLTDEVDQFRKSVIGE
jgi:hypothetical protein